MNHSLVGKHHNNNLILINLVSNKLKDLINNFRLIGVHHHLINNNLIKVFKEIINLIKVFKQIINLIKAFKMIINLIKAFKKIINLIYHLIQKEYQQNQINKMVGK